MALYATVTVVLWTTFGLTLYIVESTDSIVVYNDCKAMAISNEFLVQTLHCKETEELENVRLLLKLVLNILSRFVHKNGINWTGLASSWTLWTLGQFHWLFSIFLIGHSSFGTAQMNRCTVTLRTLILSCFLVLD